MKIIKQGTLPQDKIYRSTCKNCDTIFEYTQSEAKVGYDEWRGSHLQINCPVCKRKIYKSI